MHEGKIIRFDLSKSWVLLVYLRALFTYLCFPHLSHRPPHPETDSVGAVLSIFNFDTISCLVAEKKTLKSVKSTNYKHEKKRFWPLRRSRIRGFT